MGTSSNVSIENDFHFRVATNKNSFHILVQRESTQFLYSNEIAFQDNDYFGRKFRASVPSIKHLFQRLQLVFSSNKESSYQAFTKFTTFCPKSFYIKV